MSDSATLDIPIRFRKKNTVLSQLAVETLEQERPATLRQLFYRLISAGAMPNAAKEYKRLGAIMTRLRESGHVPRSWLVDHTRSTLKPSSWSGLQDFGDAVQRAYRLDFWARLPIHVEVFVEKDAVAGTIQPITHEYDVALQVCRGYASISFAGGISDEWRRIEKPIHAYYVGDFDPSGFDIERDLREKLERYSGRTFGWTRLGVVAADFEVHQLIRLPVKSTDKRARGFADRFGDACAEVDALPPSELRNRVEDAIRSHIDSDEWDRLMHIEMLERKTVEETISRFGSTASDGSEPDTSVG